MTDATKPFLDAIIESPDDLSCYEVFADFLQEQGDPWGDFIRVQLQLESPLEDAQRSHLKRLEPNLLLAADALGRQLGELADPSSSASEWRFQRGFVSFLRFVFPLPKHMAILRESPVPKLLRWLELVDIPDGDELAEQLEEYRDVTWDDSYSPTLEALQSARFPNLRRFRIGGEYTSADDVHLVLRNMPRLEQLTISARYLNAEAIGGAKLSHLQVLELERFADHPLEAIADNQSLTRLEEIHLYPRALDPGDEPYLGLDGMRKLCSANHLPRLRRLSLKCSHFGDEGIDLMIRSGLLSRLRSLDLEFGAVTDVGSQLLSAQELGRLEMLNLSGNYISPERLQELRAACPRLVSDRQFFGAPDDDLQHLYYGDME